MGRGGLGKSNKKESLGRGLNSLDGLSSDTGLEKQENKKSELHMTITVAFSVRKE